MSIRNRSRIEIANSTMNQNQETTWNAQIEIEIQKQDEANKKQEQRTRNLESKTLQNVNLYFIFQAIILVSTSTTNGTCRNWWIPLTLSLFVMVTNFSSLCSSMSKALSSREEVDQNVSDLALMKMYRMTKDQVGQVLPGTPLKVQGKDVVRPKVGLLSKWKRRVLAYSPIGMFLGFSAVLMFGCYRMLCHPGYSKCVKAC